MREYKVGDSVKNKHMKGIVREITSLGSTQSEYILQCGGITACGIKESDLEPIEIPTGDGLEILCDMLIEELNKKSIPCPTCGTELKEKDKYEKCARILVDKLVDPGYTTEDYNTFQRDTVDILKKYLPTK